jgi:hypothetical protein
MNRVRPIILLLWCPAVLACSSSSPSTAPGSTPAPASAPNADTARTVHRSDTLSFSKQRVTIEDEGGAVDLQLPYTRSITTDSAVTYTVHALYGQKEVGFDVRVPMEGLGKAQFFRTGQISDNFLRMLQKLYKQKNNGNSVFAAMVMADALSMGAYTDSLHKQGNGNYITIDQYKLFFRDDKPDEEAECYLNINQTKHWIELTEKESDYRPKLIKAFAKQ